MPGGRSLGLVTDQAPLEAVALKVCARVPVVSAPAYTLTVTVLESPVAVPAAPENVGFATFTVDPLVGLDKVTAATLESTVKVIGTLCPVSPPAVCWAAAV